MAADLASATLSLRCRCGYVYSVRLGQEWLAGEGSWQEQAAYLRDLAIASHDCERPSVAPPPASEVRVMDPSVVVVKDTLGPLLSRLRKRT